MVSERHRPDLTSDSMLAMALTRCLEVLGEAASKLSDEVRLEFPDIPFAKMISMRNRLIHACYCRFSSLSWPKSINNWHCLLRFGTAVTPAGSAAGTRS